MGTENTGPGFLIAILTWLVLTYPKATLVGFLCLFLMGGCINSCNEADAARQARVNQIERAEQERQSQIYWEAEHAREAQKTKEFRAE